MVHRFRKLVTRLRVSAPVRFGPRRPLSHPGIPTDRFLPFGDAVRCLVANGPDTLTAAATGKTDWPIADRDTAWDGGAAEQAIRKWASSDGSGDKDTVDWAKYKSCHLWWDGTSDGENFGDSKLPFTDMVGGSMKIVAKGVFACAAVIQGGRGGADLGDDVDAVKSKLETIYKRLADEFDDDSIKAPWLNDDAAVDVVDALRAELNPTPVVLSKYAGMTETQRREADGDNEVTGEALDALVASLLAGYPEERRQALTAATNANGEVVGAAWHAYLCAEGIRTDDGRELALNSARFPDLPVSLRITLEDEGGHWGAVTCGRLETMERQENVPQDGINLIYSTGMFGSDPNGQLAELMVTEQTQRFVSIDPRDVTAEVIEIEISRESLFDVVIIGDDDDDCPDDDGKLFDSWVRYTDFVIGAATIVPMPAIQNAVIALADVALPDSPIATASAPKSPVVASSAPVAPPAEWFENPNFGHGSASAFDPHGDSRLVLQEDNRSFACPWTITPEGRVLGHVSWWLAVHTGFQGRKVHPPHSRSGYAYYLTGPGVECADGTMVEGVAQVTAGCGHASTDLAWKAAAAHYDGGAGAFQVADVRCGEDAYGIWIAGALRSDLTPEQLREARALAPSGDWRDIGGSLEMVAALLVPVPGFPVRRSVVAAGNINLDEFGAFRMGVGGDERILSLVAAGRVRRVDPVERIAALEATVARLEAQVRPLAVEQARRIIG